ncbi:inactive tyrosine-protein kinase PRAG1 [Hoplias malabaricus]|uniref:inactive tyrosine-protein kinase PRAG1 n=1 Tax=Hoplias malabaricus TaxID=27720 RepID=UPI00346304DB
MDCKLQGSTADTKPPALPIKQRRSSSSTSSAPDLQLEGNLQGSSPFPSPSYDVFTAPADCNADQCPIHHKYGYHQGRFFSDQTPPPIPKKKLARTLSLPAESLSSTLQFVKRPHYYAIPFYTAEDSTQEHAGENKKEDDLKGHGSNLLTFDTPDQHLPGFFSSFSHQEQVYGGIQNRYLEFLRNAVKEIEAKVLLGEQEVEQLKTLQPEDFIVYKKFQPEKTDEGVFYMVYALKRQDVFFSAKVSNNDSATTCSMSLPHHPNIEEAVRHFSSSRAQEKQLSKLWSATEASELLQEGSAEQEPEDHTVLSLLEKGLAVTIVRDFPQGTLEDFVQEGISLHCSHPDVYERRLCLLVLQLALGLQHLESHNVKNAELSPQKIMLVWSYAKNKRSAEEAETIGDPKEGQTRNLFQIYGDADKCGRKRIGQDDNRSVHRVHKLWEKWGLPRIAISQTSFSGESMQEAPPNGFQLGNLLMHCLHIDMDKHQNTQYTPGLLNLIKQLTAENTRLQMAEVIGVLQALLWGPRAGLFEKNQPNTAVLHNWLMVKRSLLVLKLAEKGLFFTETRLDWEVCLCLQYLAFAEPETVLKTTAQLGLYNNVRLV